MVPTWMIEDIERRRREREARERPQLRIELPVRTENQPLPRRPAPSGRIVIELGGAPRDDRAVLENVEHLYQRMIETSVSGCDG